MLLETVSTAPQVSTAAPPELEVARDAARMARVAAGNDVAFRELYDRYSAEVARVAFGVLLDSEESLDVVQEAFAALVAIAPRWEPKARVGAWLCRVAVRRSLNLRRRLKVRARPVEVVAAPTESPDWDHALDHAKRRRTVLAAIATLSPRQRAVATLHLDRGLSPQEIAEVLDIRPNAARVNLHRALAKLRERIAVGTESAVPHASNARNPRSAPEENNR